MDYFVSLNLKLNLDKTVFMLFNRGSVELKLGDSCLKRVTDTTFLGMIINEKLNWSDHCDALVSKLNKGNFVISRAVGCLGKSHVRKVYYAHFHSHLSYGIEIWGDERVNKNDCQRIFRKQKMAVKIIRFGYSRRRQSCRGLLEN